MKNIEIITNIIDELGHHVEIEWDKEGQNHVEPVWSIEAKALLETHPDPSKIWPQFAIFLLLDETQCAGRHPQCHVVAELYKKELDGDYIVWDAVRSNVLSEREDAWVSLTTKQSWKNSSEEVPRPTRKWHIYSILSCIAETVGASASKLDKRESGWAMNKSAQAAKYFFDEYFEMEKAQDNAWKSQHKKIFELLKGKT